MSKKDSTEEYLKNFSNPEPFYPPNYQLNQDNSQAKKAEKKENQNSDLPKTKKMNAKAKPFYQLNQTAPAEQKDPKSNILQQKEEQKEGSQEYPSKKTEQLSSEKNVKQPIKEEKNEKQQKQNEQNSPKITQYPSKKAEQISPEKNVKSPKKEEKNEKEQKQNAQNSSKITSENEPQESSTEIRPPCQNKKEEKVGKIQQNQENAQNLGNKKQPEIAEKESQNQEEKIKKQKTFSQKQKPPRLTTEFLEETVLKYIEIREEKQYDELKQQIENHYDDPSLCKELKKFRQREWIEVPLSQSQTISPGYQKQYFSSSQKKDQKEQKTPLSSTSKTSNFQRKSLLDQKESPTTPITPITTPVIQTSKQPESFGFGLRIKKDPEVQKQWEETQKRQEKIRSNFGFVERLSQVEIDKRKKEVKLALNQLNPNVMDHVIKQLLPLSTQSPDFCQYMVELIISKAKVEKKYTQCLAILCHALIDNPDPIQEIPKNISEEEQGNYSFVRMFSHEIRKQVIGEKEIHTQKFKLDDGTPCQFFEMPSYEKEYYFTNKKNKMFQLVRFICECHILDKISFEFLVKCILKFFKEFLLGLYIHKISENKEEFEKNLFEQTKDFETNMLTVLEVYNTLGGQYIKSEKIYKQEYQAVPQMEKIKKFISQKTNLFKQFPGDKEYYSQFQYFSIKEVMDFVDWLNEEGLISKKLNLLMKNLRQKKSEGWQDNSFTIQQAKTLEDIRKEFKSQESQSIKPKYKDEKLRKETKYEEQARLSKEAKSKEQNKKEDPDYDPDDDYINEND